ncbi:MAG: zincin-like metallopeptidase domain-containing protein [Paracoccaceae bacterium]|nr:zincin-like metallopeptidase domain-containing protein [Paracoccaceae bacterium]
MTTRASAYSEITMKIVEELEKGRHPWSPGWDRDTIPMSLPRRWTGDSYQGINVLVLWMSAAKNGFTSSRWFTYRQARNVGGQVRRGERSTGVIYYENRVRLNDDGEEEEHRFLRNYRVFNADQIDNLPEPFLAPDSPQSVNAKSEEIDRLIGRTGATISERRNARDAFYLVSADRIVMPHRDSFSPVERFYSVLMHELIHWTGNPARLARLSRDDTDRDYAFEELVAEIGSCFACASLGLVPDIGNSASYIRDWADRLKADHKVIFKAAGAAQKAADFLLGRMQSA